MPFFHPYMPFSENNYDSCANRTKTQSHYFFVLLFAVTYYSSIFADYNKLNLIGDCSLIERAIDLKNSEQICLSLV